jgi:hypothetical protein
MKILLTLLLTLSSFSFAKTSGAGDAIDSDVLTNTQLPVSTATPSLHQKLGLWLADSHSKWDVAFGGGVQVFRSVASPAVDLTVRRPGSLWSLEAGAAIPVRAGDNFKSQSDYIDGTTYISRVKSFYEIHLTANHEFPFGDQKWILPNAAFGVSVMVITDNTDASTPVTINNTGVPYTYDSVNSYGRTSVSFSPLFRLGVTLFPDKLVSLRSDVAYIGYGNTASAAGQTFDLGFGGVMFREMLQVRL